MILGLARKVYPRENWAILKKKEAVQAKSTVAAVSDHGGGSIAGAQIECDAYAQAL